MPQRSRYLDPVALSRLKNLGLAARLVVEGFYAGQHRSPHRGFSVEFAEHRQYTPGVSPRHVDWRVFARRDKLYVKQYEEETSLRCYLVLDRSGSMGYRHAGPLPKLEYGAFLAACLATIMCRQNDAVGLMTCNTAATVNVPPRQGMNQLRAILEHLENTSAAGETNIGRTLHDLAESVKRRALIIVISDLLDDPAAVAEALQHIRHRKHEVIVFQVLDPSEVSFPFEQATCITDVENRREVVSDPEAFRKAWIDGIRNLTAAVKRACRQSRIDYELVETGKPFDAFLQTYLARREATGGRH